MKRKRLYYILNEYYTDFYNKMFSYTKLILISKIIILDIKDVP